ncbi:MAG: hypothetical protein MR355_05650 [Lachnospiraceae bacterium]|nr:hypothetical protein [Lachnospiraceae bacterium]
MLCNQVQTEIERYISIVETAAMQEAVISLDYTQAEPYLQKLMEQDKDMWSHFIIANQYGTEQAHTEGNDYTTDMKEKAEIFEKGAASGKDGTIIQISETMDKNSSGLTEISEDTSEFAMVLQGIHHEIENCDSISEKMQESLTEFHKTEP